MTDLGDAIRALLEEESISQQMLASRALVSQSTVSRALKGTPERNSQARVRLVRFMQQYAARKPAPAPAHDALRDVWDGSSEHAVALAALLRASRELWPNLQSPGGNDDG